MDEGTALLLQIAADLNDDLLRRAYADLSRENGDEDLALFICLQLSAACGRDLASDNAIEKPLTPELAASYTARANELLTLHRTEWEAPIRDALGASCREVIFHRGFPSGVTVNGVQELINSAILESNTNTLTALTVRYLGSQLAELLSHPGIAKLTTLNMHINGIGTVGAIALANSPNLATLATLRLQNNHIGTAGAIALADSPHLTNLTMLDLGNNGIGTAGATAIANSRHLANLTTLLLGGNNILSAGATAIANSRHLANLTTLNLWFNGIETAGAIAIANSPHLTKLNTLYLEDNGIGRVAAAAIAASTHLSPSAKITGLRAAGFNTLADQVDGDAQRYDGRE